MPRAKLDAHKKALAEDGYIVINGVVPDDKLAGPHAKSSADQLTIRCESRFIHGVQDGSTAVG